MRSAPLNLHEFEARAKEVLPDAVWNRIAGGAQDEITLRRNREAFEEISLRPRRLVDVTNREVDVTVLGKRISFPVMIAPAGTQKTAHPEGELASVRAAGAAGTIMALSTTASCSIEEVAGVANGPLWFQLYHYNHDLSRMLIELAVAHGVQGIIVSNHGGRTLDSQVAIIDALPEVVQSVDGRCEVYLDGGVRRGTDVLKALALGARAVLIGRPLFWGLAVEGEAGLRRVLEILRDELDLAMAYRGRTTISSIDRRLVERPTHRRGSTR